MKTYTQTIGFVLAIVLCVAPGTVVEALTFTWTGNVNTNWNNAGNWDLGGAVPDADDVAIIASNINNTYPDLEINVQIQKLQINSNARCVVGNNNGARTLTITDPSGLSVQSSGKLIIEVDGKVDILGGGVMDLLGDIELNTGSGSNAPTLRVRGTLEVLRSTTLNADNGDIVATTTAFIEGYDGDGYWGNLDDTLVLGYGHEMRGLMEIKVLLVNNGIVHADRAGDLVLSCTPKMGGGGVWRVSHANAKLKVDTPVVSGRCGDLVISAGEVEINDAWISCGALHQSGGLIDADRAAIFQQGGCTDLQCDCPIESP